MRSAPRSRSSARRGTTAPPTGRAPALDDAYGRGKVGMVHFDAHADTGRESWGNPASHATPMRRLIASGAIPGRNFVQLGLRGFWPERETFEWMRSHGMRWHLMGE